MSLDSSASLGHYSQGFASTLLDFAPALDPSLAASVSFRLIRPLIALNPSTYTDALCSAMAIWLAVILLRRRELYNRLSLWIKLIQIRTFDE